VANETTLSQIPSAKTEYYNRTFCLLTNNSANLVYRRFFDEAKIPINESNVIKFRKYGRFDAQTTQLDEGEPPTPVQGSKTDITGTLIQLGAYMKITDMVEFTNADKIFTVYGNEFAYNAALSIDSYLRDIAAAGTSYRRASGVTNRTDIVNSISRADLDIAIRALKRANAPRIDGIMKGSQKIGTSPIPPSYVAITHPDVITDAKIACGTAWKSVEEYASYAQVYPGEEGSYDIVRFISSTNAKVWREAGGGNPSSTGLISSTGTLADVYSIIIFGQHGAACTELAGRGLQFVIQDGFTPLKQFRTSGWISALVGKIVDETNLYRIECGAKVTPTYS